MLAHAALAVAMALPGARFADPPSVVPSSEPSATPSAQSSYPAVGATAIASPAALTAAIRAEDAIIANSGSTNALGYTIFLAPDGSAIVRRGAATEQRTVARPQTRWLFSRLAAAGPLDQLAGGHCMKSVSFGTTTSIAWHGASSGDLSCRPSPLGAEISRTIAVIVDQLEITLQPRRRVIP